MKLYGAFLVGFATCGFVISCGLWIQERRARVTPKDTDDAPS